MSARIFALIAVQAIEPLSLNGLSAKAERVFPGRPFRLEALGESTEHGRLDFTMNDIPMTILSVPAPIPAPTWQAALPDVLDWKDAVQAMQNHRAHHVVAAIKQAGTHLEALANAFAVTLASTLLCHGEGGVGVYWNSSERLASASVFVKAGLALGMDTALKALPTDIWVRTRFAKDESSRVGAITTGLIQIAGREVELTPSAASAQKIAMRASALTYQLLRHGITMRDGDTVEIEGDVLRASVTTRGKAGSIPVLTFEEAGDALR